MVFYNNNLNYLYTIPTTTINTIPTSTINTIPTSTINTSIITNTNNISTYFIPPPFYYGVDVYTNVNIDPNLRQMVTEFFLKKSIKWIKTQPDFSKYKNILELLNSSKGYNIIYNLLREFCHKYNIKWYDLRETNYDNIKHFLYKKFSTF
jgi:hypothetical protein